MNEKLAVKAWMLIALLALAANLDCRSDKPRSPMDSEARDAGDPYGCRRDEDCVLTCANGALNREWSRRHAGKLQMCLDGCEQGADLPRCGKGVCTAMRGGKPDLSCTRKKILWMPGAQADIGGAADRSPAPTGITSLDPDLISEIVESWGPQKNFFMSREFVILEWEPAKTLLLRKTYRGGKQYHIGWLTIYTNDGKSYLTRPPQLDDFFKFMKSARLPTEGFAPE
jgi:hypothetical protein